MVYSFFFPSSKVSAFQPSLQLQVIEVFEHLCNYLRLTNCERQARPHVSTVPRLAQFHPKFHLYRGSFKLFIDASLAVASFRFFNRFLTTPKSPEKARPNQAKG
jgi:hypothetical protein